MSRFFSKKYAALEAYTPGEQPRDQQYVKLNTNESPFPPAPAVLQAVEGEAGRLQLYSDPTCKELVSAAADYYGVAPEQILMTNGSDEILNFAFMAFCDEEHPIVFPDITYGFYPVFAQLNGIPYEELPLQEDFTVRVEDYCGIGKNIVLANPNAPTGRLLASGEIRRILESNPDHIVIIDEAYIDFGGESCVPLVKEYPNLLVTQTFSKSRSLAGARLGLGIGQAELMADLNTLKYSTNPYNVNRMTMAAGAAAIRSAEYYDECCRIIRENRAYTARRLEQLGFTVLPSAANFLFVRHSELPGDRLYRRLKEKGVLVRHFTKTRISEFNRVTIGTKEQMDVFLSKTEEILKEGLK